MNRKTNRGQVIDWDALVAAHSETIASGNMGVNAQGDVVQHGRVVQKNEDRVRAYYKDNPRSSTSQASLKGPVQSTLKPDNVSEADEPPTAKTARENLRTAEAQAIAARKANKKQPRPSEDEVREPDRYEEVEDEDGNFTMVPIWDDDE